MNARKSCLILLVTACLLPVSVGAGTQEQEIEAVKERLAKMEKTVDQLVKRIVELETIIKRRQEQDLPVTQKGNWRDLKNWRRLQVGMTMEQVSELLGEPEKVNMIAGSAFWYWAYPGGPSIHFSASKVSGWSEPSR